MNCKKARILCQELLDGELSGKEREALLQHLSSCSECARFLKENQKLRELLSNLPSPQLTPAFNSRVLEEIKRRERAHYRPLPSLRLAKRALLFLIPLFLLFFLLFNIHLGKPSEEDLFNSYRKEHILYTMQNPLISEDAAVKILLVSGQE